MSFIRKLFNFYINSSIHVAIAVIAFVGVTAIEFDLSLSLYLLLFVFSGTITGYNFVKYAEVAGLHHRSLTKDLKTIQVFSIFCFLVFCYAAYHISRHTLLFSGFLGFITMLYAVPVFAKKNLRMLGGLKIFIVALVWAGVTVLLPMIENNMNVTTDYWLSFIQRFLMVIVLIFPFDIRDVAYDSTLLRTFPQQFGIKKTKGIGLFLVTVILLLEGFEDEISEAHIYSLVLVLLLISIALVRAKTKQSRYFASFFVESIPIVYFVFILLFTYFLS
ncbi:hypothetical protein ULMS_11020 [Patiriisocius marinistellae]|uniref:Prenyltransferase n=1 Tax=Patiriisocius marinistellae TaxID=2494560 RepID=A0A5J4FWL6_9FLAO|nr:hypothetical protein [Patiriisocius marinistellae]GEQ85594.1 hypothetical protein ULMS_11020 [Patiriisocius marinistellae]